MQKSSLLTKRAFTWALYDWANSAFALSVLAVLFPIVLGNFWGVADGGAAATLRLSWITFAASVLVFLSAPVLGTIADAGGYRKRFLALFAITGAVATAGLGLVGEGEWRWALALYLLASIGYYSSIIFYDSLLVDVTEPRNYSFVSTLGFSIGYLGSAILLALHLWMLKSPQTFGLANATEAFSFAFISVGIWWLLFSLPLLFFVPESRGAVKVKTGAIRAAYSELRSTVIEISKYRNVTIFLSAYWLYLGGVFTVIFMATNYGQRLGFSDSDLVMALLISNFVGFPATLIYGLLAHRFGAKKGIYFALAAYVGACLWGTQMTEVKEFYIMAVVIGAVQGGVQGLSRSVYASLIPSDQPGKFFGFYSMTTKFAHILGPATVAIVATLSDDQKWVLLALIPMFVAGALLLSQVRMPSDAPASK